MSKAPRLQSYFLFQTDWRSVEADTQSYEWQTAHWRSVLAREWVAERWEVSKLGMLRLFGDHGLLGDANRNA